MTVEQNERDIQELRLQFAQLLDIIFDEYIADDGRAERITEVRDLKDKLTRKTP